MQPANYQRYTKDPLFIQKSFPSRKKKKVHAAMTDDDSLHPSKYFLNPQLYNELPDFETQDLSDLR
jgi:hypothetical protein